MTQLPQKVSCIGAPTPYPYLGHKPFVCIMPSLALHRHSGSTALGLDCHFLFTNLLKCYHTLWHLFFHEELQGKS